MIAILRFWETFVRTLIRFDYTSFGFICRSSFTSHLDLSMKRSLDSAGDEYDDAPICAICRTAVDADEPSVFSLCSHEKHRVHSDCGKLYWANRLATSPKSAVQCPVCMRSCKPEQALDVLLSLLESKDLTYGSAGRWHEFLLLATDRNITRPVEDLKPVLDLLRGSPMTSKTDHYIMMACMIMSRGEIPWDILETFAVHTLGLSFETLMQSSNLIALKNLLKHEELVPDRVWDFLVGQIVEPIVRLFIESGSGLTYFKALYSCILEYVHYQCISKALACDFNAWFNTTVANATRHTDAIDALEFKALKDLVDNMYVFGLRLRLDTRELAKSYQKFVSQYAKSFEAYRALFNADEKFRSGVLFWNMVFSKTAWSFTPAVFTGTPELTWDKFISDHIVTNRVPVKIRGNHHDIVWLYAFVQSKTQRLTAAYLRRLKSVVRSWMGEIIEFFHEEPLANLVSLLCVVQDRPLIQDFCGELLVCFVAYERADVRHDDMYPILSNVVLLMRCSAKPSAELTNKVARESIKVLQKGIAPDRIQRAAYEFLLLAESSIEEPLPDEVKAVFADRWPDIAV